MFLYTWTFPERAAPAALYIKFLAVVLASFSIGLIVISFGKEKENNEEIKWVVKPASFLMTIGAIIIYVILLNFFGFLLSSFLFMVVLSWVLGFKKKIKLIIGTSLLLASIHFVFVGFLAVPVPTGLF